MASITQRIPVLFSQIARNSQTISATKNTPQLFDSLWIPQRLSSFRSSKPVQDLSEYPEVEVVKNPPEWKYVERLIAPKTIPKPVAKTEYPSGWKPPQPVNEKQKYFVARTKNFMLPVYLHTKYRGERRITIVRYIQGDIWSLERELHAAIDATRNGKLVASRINELSGQIHFHGDYVNLVKDFLLAKGF